MLMALDSLEEKLMRRTLALWFGIGVGLIACSEDASTAPPPDEVQCNTPPATECVDASTLRRYDAEGIVEDDSDCVYPYTDTVCETQCSDNACVGEPCAGVVCDDPPSSICENDAELRVFEEQGACAAEECSYASTLVPCEHGCDQELDQCANDPCVDVVCNNPPPAECADSDTLRTYGAEGTCQDGNCTYTPQLTPCEHGCNQAEPACNAEPPPPPPLVQVRNYGACAGKNLYPLAGEEAHWVAVRLEPPHYPFQVEEIEYGIVDYYDIDTGVTCLAGLQHKVQIYKASTIAPPASPTVLAEVSVPATSWSDTYRTVRLTLESPLTITASDDIFVAVQFAGTYPQVQCVRTCGDLLQPEHNYWSNASNPPYSWQPLSTWDIEGHAQISVWGR